MSGAITWENLLKWDYAPLEDAYQEVSRRQMALEQAGDTCHATVFAFADEGEAADVLRDLVHDYRNRADRLEALLTDMMMALNHAAEEVEKVAEEALRLDAQVAAEGATIDSFGHVSSNLTPHVHSGNRAQADMRTAENINRLQDSAINLLSRAESIATRFVQAMSPIDADAPSQPAMISADSLIPRSNRAIVLAMKELPAAQVRAYWESLDAGRQQHLIREFPQSIGNLSGIPFAVRTRANKYNAETYIDRIHREHPDLDEQIRRLEAQKANGISQLNPYEHIPQTEKLSTAELRRLESLYDIRANLQVATNITSGDQAILFDPDNDRIIIANGDLTTPPDHAITFAPGTGTDMTSFANSLTGISDAIVTELSERGRSSVVFTVMDGPWSTWLGEGFNGSEAEMAERAEKIQDLANNIRLEDYGTNTEHVGIGYSAGESKFAISESKGHVTDESISIGGSYVGHSWIPDPNAEYTHIQYSHDAINILDTFGVRTPNSLEAFEKVYIPSPSGDGGQDHALIAKGLDENRAGVAAIVDEIID